MLYILYGALVLIAVVMLIVGITSGGGALGILVALVPIALVVLLVLRAARGTQR